MDKIHLTYYGHACFTIEFQNYRIAIDPYGGYVPGYAPLHLRANEVLCSHAHGDHSYIEGVDVVPGGFTPFSIIEIEVPHDNQGGTLRGMSLIRVFECAGIRVGHFGDIGCWPEKRVLQLLHGLDAAMIPVGGRYTIAPYLARRLADTLEAKIVIPMHYRLDALGFREIAPLDRFVSKCGQVNYYEGNSLDITRNPSSQTAVLTYSPPIDT